MIVEVGSVGHLLWWGTNTRAVGALLAASESSRVPVVLVLDPVSEPPAENLLSGITVRERKFGPVSRNELADLVRGVILETGLQSLVLAPTSEYLQRLVHSDLKFFRQEGLDAVPRSKLSYLSLSDKENLPLLSQWGLSFPRPKSIDGNKANFPFVAKPRRNISGLETLRPFVVHDDESMRRYGYAEGDFFAEELVVGESFYWCGFRAEDQEIVGYFQHNHAQVRGGGSISAASRLNGNQFHAERAIIDAFLESVDYRGPIMFEFRGDDFVLIEINPRFWGPLLLDLISESTILRKYFESIFSTLFVPPALELLGDTYVVPSMLADSVFPKNCLLPSADWEQDKVRILEKFGGLRSPGLGGDW